MYHIIWLLTWLASPNRFENIHLFNLIIEPCNFLKDMREIDGPNGPFTHAAYMHDIKLHGNTTTPNKNGTES